MGDASRDRGSWVRWQERKLLRCALGTDGATEHRKHGNPRVRLRREKTNRYGCRLYNRSLEILNGAIITTVFDVDDTALSTVEVGDHG